MANKNHIKVLTTTTKVEVNDSDNLITLDPDVSVSLEFTETEGYTDEEINNVQWIANMFHGRPQNSNFHPSLKGPKAKFRVPAVYSGGGLGWVEPVIPGNDPQFKAPFGYFINAIGKRSIDKVEWRDIHGGELSGSKFFTEAVQLHIYTTGLYGHEIQVTLYDKDTISSNDQLELDEDVNDNDTSNLAKYFNREVKVLQDADDDTSKVQKVVIDVRLEKRWGEKEESELELIADVVCKIDGGVKKLFDKNVLIIKTPKKEEEDKVNNATKSGNKPVIIGDIVTDVAEFKPCFYTKITGEVMRGEEKVQDVVIYEQGKTAPDQTRLTFPVVAGTEYSKAQIKITLDSDTGDCLLTKVHKDRVIDLSNIPDAVVVESRLTGEKNRIADSSKVFDVNKNNEKTRNSADENDGDNKGAHTSTIFNKNDSFLETALKTTGNYSSSIPNEATKTNYVKEASSDTEVEIDLLYSFSKARDQQSVIDTLLANIWPIHKSAPISYPITFNTCRKKITVNIDVYPDIKWILKFAYNYDTDKYNAMLKDEHKKYEDKVDKLERTFQYETVTERGRLRDLEEYKKRAKKRKRIVENKLKKTENLEKIGQLSTALSKAENDIKKWDNKIDKANKKIEAEEKEELDPQKSKAKSNKKESIKNKRKLKNALNNGIADFNIALASEWDRPYKGIEINVLKDYKKVKNLLDNFVGLMKDIKSVVKGNHPKAQPNKNDDSKFSELKAKLEDVLNRQKQVKTTNIIPPSVAAALIWYAEHPKTESEPMMGIVGEATLVADPIIGVEIKWDILALVASKHPIARGIVLAMDLISKIGADESEIRLDFSVEGRWNFDAKGMINFANGKTNFNSGFLAKDDDDSPIGSSVQLKATLTAKLLLKAEYEHWLFSDVKVDGELHAEANMTTGITGEARVKADNKGMYVDLTATFNGIQISLHLSASAELTKGKEGDKESLLSIKPKVYDETIILMNKCDLGTSGKWYLT